MENTEMMKRTTMPQMERRDYPCWAVIERAPDIEGKWVAHCLDFDTLAQADDPATALELLLASTIDIVLDDLRAGVDPSARRAPDDDEHWSLLPLVVRDPAQARKAEPAFWNEVSAKMDALVVAQFFLGFIRSFASPHLAPESAQATLLFRHGRDINSAAACM